MLISIGGCGGCVVSSYPHGVGDITHGCNIYRRSARTAQLQPADGLNTAEHLAAKAPDMSLRWTRNQPRIVSLLWPSWVCGLLFTRTHNRTIHPFRLNGLKLKPEHQHFNPKVRVSNRTAAETNTTLSLNLSHPAATHLL